MGQPQERDDRVGTIAMWVETDNVPSDREPSSYAHTTVMRAEAVAQLKVRAGGVYVDATLGGGGHTEAMLEAVPGAMVIGVDRDPAALAAATHRLARFGDRFLAIRGAFGDLDVLLATAGIGKVDGILADLGLSSAQLANPSRGMSFRFEGPIDMRMDPSLEETALSMIARLDQDQLADVIYRFGEESRSRRIARSIKRAEQDGRLNTTLDLRQAVVRAVGPARVGGVDPATRTFQALRIAVNGEMDQLGWLLEKAPLLLVDSGLLAVISFHSLEDRLVKKAFQNREVWVVQTKKPVLPTANEQKTNKRARSAKLRCASRLASDLAGMQEGV